MSKDEDRPQGWSFWVLFCQTVPRFAIFALSIFFANVGGSLYERLTTDVYEPYYYLWCSIGIVVGIWGMFLYNVWQIPPDDSGDGYE